MSHEVTFEQDLTAREGCHQVLLRLSELVGRRLRNNHLRGQVVRLTLRDPDFTTCTRQKKLPVSTDDDLVIYRTVRALFDAARERMAPVRLLGVAVADLATSAVADDTPGDTDRDTDAEGGLFSLRETDQDRLLEAMDKIRDRFGEDAIRRSGGKPIDRRTHG